MLGDQVAPCLDATGMLLNVAIHASLGRSEARLVPLRDVAEIAESDEVDWSLLASWAKRWRLTVVFQDAFRTASTVLGWSAPEAARSILAARTTPAAARSLAAYQGRRRSLGGTSLTTVRAIPGVGNKVAYLRALAVPDRAFLQARANGAGEATYRARWSIAMRWGTGRLRSRRRARTAVATEPPASRLLDTKGEPHE
jgi:hypothetical protein